MPGHYLRESYEYSCKVFEAFGKREEVDFVYAKGFVAWRLIEEKQKGYKCASVGINFHGYEMFQRAPSIKSSLEQKLLLRKPVLLNIHHADYVFSYGGKITEIIKDLGVASNKIIESPAGIEPSWLINKPIFHDGYKRRFLFIGRYEERKGIRELNRAISKFPIGQFEFHFVGNIPDNKKTIREDVVYHGMISDSTKIKQIMQHCDVLVCPSYSEGMPNVILEAMASGLAIIATDVGAVNLMVSKQNGWLLENSDVALIARIMKEALKLPENELLMKKKSSIDIVQKNFLWSNIIQKQIMLITKYALSDSTDVRIV